MTTPPLSDHQLSFFKTHGYLILRQILDPALLAKARALVGRCATFHASG